MLQDSEGTNLQSKVTDENYDYDGGCLMCTDDLHHYDAKNCPHILCQRVCSILSVDQMI